MAGGEDNRAGSAGVHGQVGGRSAPTVWNAAFSAVQFWEWASAELGRTGERPQSPIQLKWA